jgi:hypothetical protein
MLLLLTLFACNQTPTDADCALKAQAEDSEGNTVQECPVVDTPPVEDGDDDEVTELPPDETPVDEGVPAMAALFGATVKYTNFTAADIDKVEAALEFIQKIIRTATFKDRVLNHTYNGKKQFVDNKGLTNEQIYQKLLEGAETLLPSIDNQMDLDLELYANYSTSTVGYTYANTIKIWMNRKYFDAYDAEEVARNVFHEWTHKLGFTHASSATSSRPYSVPYALGSIMEDLAYKM